MTRKSLLVVSALSLGSAGMLGALYAAADGVSATASAPVAPAAQTQAVVDAANAFLNSLDADQRAKVQFAFTTQKDAVVAKFKRSGGPGGTRGGGGPGGRGGPGGGGPGGGRNGGGPGRSDGGGPDGGRPDRGGPDGAGRDGGGPSSRPAGDRQFGQRGGGDRGPGRGPGGGGSGMGAGFAFEGEQYGQSVWSNYPVSDVPRPGVPLGRLKPAQRAAAMQLLQAMLSPMGYQKVIDIMGADQALADGGTNYAAGNDVYTLGIFGMPSATTPWMVQFGGHHLGLNLTVIGEHGVLTPTMTGAQPALYTAHGKTIRPVGAENDKAFTLLDALDPAQRKQAILNYAVGDLVFGPGHPAQAIVPEGLKASDLNDSQRALLLDVINEWAGIANDSFAAARMQEIKAGLSDTYFAWSGPTTHTPGKNGTAYYRIQGPKLVIEFSPQGVGGDKTLHVHTVYRDPTNDYGKVFTPDKN